MQYQKISHLFEQQLGAVVASLAELRTPRHARLAVGAAVTFAGFVAGTYVERAGRGETLAMPAHEYFGVRRVVGRAKRQ